MERMAEEASPAALFGKPPVIPFFAEKNACSCGQKYVVQKIRQKTVLSMTGPFIAHETLLQCPKCRVVSSSEQLQRIVSPRCNTAYDVLVFVGRSLFQRFRTSSEIRAELVERNVFISASEIHYLGRKFITLLAEAHRLATPRIRRSMKFAGGYVLHIDAMHEGGVPALMTGMDSLSDIILSSVKVSSENTENTALFLTDLKNRYGLPTACVHDMGTGICRAVNEVFPGVHDYICHFHFLRDIGKDYLEPAYQVLRHCLQQHAASSKLHAIAREARQELGDHADQAALLADAIKQGSLADSGLLPQAWAYSCALWIIQGKHAGDGYGFPFDRPLLEFATRLFTFDSKIEKLRSRCDPERKNPLFSKLAKLLSKIKNDRRFCMAVEELKWRTDIFDQLRKAMRIALPDGHNGLNDDGSTKTMNTIRQGVADFRRQTEKSPKLMADSLTVKMLAQIDKYNDKLFADPIDVDTPAGKITICPQRTNNILERLFRSQRRGYRRRSGNNSMRRFLQAMLADTPLVKNLDNPDYMEILLDGKIDLEELFAEIDSNSVTEAKNTDNITSRVLPGYRSLIALPDLPDKLAGSFSNPAMAKSN